ncbi:MAG: ParB/Srx family N-terminal domain-containing protein [Magnetococcales bacterium]|nr:ParB/Srx family N-terminal domain-containing protein [Magnetococcales bacterium]
MKKIDTLEKGDIFKLPVDQAHPTQFAVGMVAVDCKKREMEKAHASGKLEEILCQEGHLVPVVVGPENVLYLTDHHHLSSAIWRADLPGEAKWVYAYIYEDWREKPRDRFWNEMIENNLAWLYDDKGDGPLNPRMLPGHIGELLNDPYRTLSRWLRDCGCYTKDVLKERKNPICTQDKFLPAGHAKAFFIEFRWANFLRQNVKLEMAHEDFSRTCAAMPYSSLYLVNEATALKNALNIVVDLIGCHALNTVNYDNHGCLIKS